MLAMIRTLDIAWIAGLLEGEGSFSILKGSPIVQMQSTDRDVIERAAGILGIKFHDTPCKPRGPDYYKPVWKIALSGTRAIAWMMTIYQFLGERRQEKVRGIIEQWKSAKSTPRGWRGTRLMAMCHPDRVRCGNGLCRPCYMQKYRKRTGKNGNYYRLRAEEA